MVKKELLAMRLLKATPTMLKVEADDVPTVKRYDSWYRKCSFSYRKYALYLRCLIQNNILKIALFHAEYLRAGSRMPSYDVYIDRAAHKFITYDRREGKWRTAMVDHLERPSYTRASEKPWISPADRKMICEYLGVSDGGLDDIRAYQAGIRKEELLRRQKRETEPWDMDMSLIPDLPKDWTRWVDKVGIPENFIFYRADRKGVKQGYCSYCGKDVPVSGRHRHNQQGRCIRCRHEIIFKAVGKMAQRISTSNHCVYLLQSIPDGLVSREFWVRRSYGKNSYQTPEIYCNEQRRMLYDSNLQSRSYYWGWYKNRELRWIKGDPPSSFGLYIPSAYTRYGDRNGRVYGKTLPSLARTKLKTCGLVEWLYQRKLAVNPTDYA